MTVHEKISKLEAQIDELRKDLDELKKMGFRFNDSYFKKDLNNLRDALFASTQKIEEKLNRKILDLEERVNKLWGRKSK